MEDMRKEIRNRRILAIIAVLVIGFAYYVSGQEAKFRIISNYCISVSVDYDLSDVEWIDAASIDDEGNIVYFYFETEGIHDGEIFMSTNSSKIWFSDDVPTMIIFSIKNEYRDVLFTFNGKELVDTLKQINE